MPQTDESRDEALKSLDARLAAFEAKRTPKSGVATQRAMGQGYRFLGEVVGGVLGGLGFGWLFDSFAHTAPFGLIGGLLIGVGVSTFVAIRGAGAWAKTESETTAPKPDVTDKTDD
ncbi:F0F1 ATP synthase assembly protein [Phenylobacterium hankyongense]|uniref:ATP synthase protein I n=1 Tax=Phenylobacterium hankyongense TaxID=1813876 RepID=A0A328AYT0_9CAUL|nr:AtpZ/AtpI family protein [Phenylobacterium hankyongense]RAK60083.1 F0F1 ATP synthase assembly protein [Phenylobacterium hankyongense]